MNQLKENNIDVYLFQGCKDKMEIQWCLGFYYVDSRKLISNLNVSGPFVMADKEPSKWRKLDGKYCTFDVIMPLGSKDEELFEQRKQCSIEAVQALTSRKIRLNEDQ